jgi:myo-inositol-1(or 4)-monophosphatase
VGLLDGGTPIAGAVVAPALHTRYHGHVGGGAFRDGVGCRVSTTHALSQALLATGFHPASQWHAPDDNLGSFAALLPHCRGVRRCGSAALDVCMVADGTYDAYWERKLSIWDSAAAAAIALAAGAHITNLAGGPVDLAVGHLVVSNGLVHDEIVAALRPFV